MQELDDKFSDLYKKIYLVRFKGARNTDIIPESEEFFVICDEATGLAEKYSQKKATSLSLLEKYITADIVVLMLLIGYESVSYTHLRPCKIEFIARKVKTGKSPFGCGLPYRVICPGKVRVEKHIVFLRDALLHAPVDFLPILVQKLVFVPVSYTHLSAFFTTPELRKRPSI